MLDYEIAAVFSPTTRKLRKLSNSERKKVYQEVRRQIHEDRNDSESDRKGIMILGRVNFESHCCPCEMI